MALTRALGPGFTIYDPQPQRAARPAVAPTSRTTPRGGSPTDRFLQYEAQKKGQEQAQKEQESTAGGLLGRGLGIVLNNPIARTILRPLDVLDVPRRAVWSTIQEGVDAAQGKGFSPQDWYDQTNPLHVITQKGDVTFGAGDVLPQIDTPLSDGWDKWINRGTGLAGDIIGDPLTYLDGIGFVADAAKVARELEKLSTAQKATSKLADVEKLLTSMNKAGTVLPEGIAGAGERLAQLGGEAELERLGRRSLSGTNEAQRAVMDIPEPGLGVKIPFTKMEPKVIPGTERIAEAGSALKATVKQGGRQLPGMAAVREMRAPIGVLGNPLHPAYERILTGKGAGSIRGAIDTIATDNQARRGAGVFGTVAADELNRVAQEVKDFTPEQRSEMVRLAEEDPTVVNQFTEFPKKIIAIANYLGVALPEMRNGRYVMPHVLDRGFRNHLMKLVRSGDGRADDFMRQAGLTTDDLLEEGGFMQRRVWRPNEDGTPFKVKIAGQEMSIDVGSVDELNTKIKTLFPDYEGKIYETDPVLAWRRYIQATSKDVGKRYAYGEAADVGREGVFRRPDQPDQYDPFGGRVDLPPRVGPNGEEVPVQRVTANPARPMTTEQEKFYKGVPNEAATKARNKEIKKTQPQLLEEYQSAAAARRAEIGADIEALTEELIQPISAERSRMLALRNTAGVTRDNAAEFIDDFQTVTKPAIQAEMDAVDAELRRLSSARSGVSRTARERTRRRQDEILDKLDEQRRALIAQRDGLAAVYATRQGDVQAAADRALQEVRDAAPLEKARLIARKDDELSRNYSRAMNAYRSKRSELIRKWQARAEFRRGEGSFAALDRAGTNERAVAEANRLIQDNPDKFRQFVQLEEDLLQVRREYHGKYGSDIDELDANIAFEEKEIARLRPKGQDRNARIDYINEMLRRRKVLSDEQARLAPTLAKLERQLQTADMKMIANALETRTNNKRFLEYLDTNASAQHSRVVEAQRQLDAWDQGLMADGQRSIQPVNGAAAVTPEVEAARKYLQTNAAFNYIKDRNRVRALSDLAISTAKGKNKTATKKLQAELRAERRALEESLAKRSQTGRKVAAAEKAIKDAAPVQAPAARTASRGEFLDQIAADQAQVERAAQRNVNDLTNKQGEIDQQMMPDIINTETQLGDTKLRMQDIARGVDQETNQVAMDEGMAAIEKRRALADEAERAKLRKSDLTQSQQMVDQAIGEFQTVYDDAVVDFEKYRQQHAEIAAKADSTRVNRAKDRVEMTPKGKQLDEVAAGNLPAYEAQPLNRTIEDLNAVIKANPTGDDELMTRIEAALHPLEQRLADLTTELDIPAREVEQIIKAARKGELAPVISHIMKSDFRQVWQGGDVVISKELDAAYKNLTQVLSDPGQFANVLTAYTNFFKTYATLTPGFHVRNGLSAIFMNTVDGVSLGNQLDGVKLWREYANSERPLEWLMSRSKQEQDAFQSVFASGAGGRYFEAGFADSASSGKRRQSLFSNPLTRLSQKVGQDWTEGPVRLGMALDTVRAGKSVDDAIGRISRIHFDYGQVSQFDEKAKRLIPFWTFMSRNLPMQITEMWSKPKVYAWYKSFVRNMSGEEPAGTPEYFGTTGAFPFADTEIQGMPVFLQPDLGFSRVEADLTDLENALSGENLMRPLTNVNPIYTALPEYITGRDFFTGREFRPTDVRELGPLEKIGQPALAALGLLKTAPDGTKLVEERLPNMLQSLNPLYSRSARLLPGATTGADDNMQRVIESWLRFGGMPARTLSPAQQEATLRGERYDQLDAQRLQQAMLRAAGQ
jgi:hypothetical protein